MTDRVSGLEVVFDKNYREDDVKETMKLIKRIKGVVAVNKVEGSVSEDLKVARFKAKLFQRFPEMVRKIESDEDWNV